jgi:SnoaL-like domain
MARSNSEVAVAMWQAMRDEQAESILELVDSQVELHTPSGVRHGHAGLLEAIADLRRQPTEAKVIKTSEVDDRNVLMTVEMVSPAFPTPVRFAQVWSFDAGKLVLWRFFQGVQAALAALATEASTQKAETGSRGETAGA